jgi:hypothetical protein
LKGAANVAGAAEEDDFHEGLAGSRRNLLFILRQRGGSSYLLPTMSILNIPVAAGELFDKISILEIKDERIDDPEKRANVRKELRFLNDRVAQAGLANPDLVDLRAELKTVNEKLWDIEDAIRECERRQDFGDHFIALARAVYITNDRRADLKKQVNRLLGSEIVEEKSYTAY